MKTEFHRPFLSLKKALRTAVLGITGAIVAWAATPLIGSASGLPIVTRYAPPMTAIKEDVRAVVRTGDGTLIVGSNVLSVFDGARWQTIPIPNRYGFRALAPAKSSANGSQRTWIGAIGEIGYAERDGNGAWHYTSLVGKLRAVTSRAIGDVWSVHALEHGAVWTTQHQIIRWTEPNGGDLKVWDLSARSRLASFDGGDVVFIHQDGTGLLELNADGAPTLLVAEPELPQRPVTWMLPRKSGEIWIGLGDQAFSWSRVSGFVQLEVLSAALKGTLPTCAKAIGDDRVAIGTFTSGVVLVSATGREVTRYSTNEGLLDRSVYSLWAEQDHLWIASPGGLARIDSADLTSWWDARQSLQGGRPIKALEHRGQSYLLTNEALFHAGEMTPVMAASVPLTDATDAHGDLFVSAYSGIWRIEQGVARQEVFAGADISRLCASSQLPRGVIFIEGYQLKALVPSARGDWAVRDLHAAVQDSPVSLLEDAHGDVWVSTVQRGLERFEWAPRVTDGALQLKRVVDYRPGTGLPAYAGRTVLHRFGERLIASSDAGMLVLRSDQRAFEPIESLKAYRPIAADDFGHWLVQSGLVQPAGVFAMVRIRETEDGSLAPQPLDVAGLDEYGPFKSVDVTVDGTVWIGGTRGWLRVERGALGPPPHVPAPRLLLTHEQETSRDLTFLYAVPATTSGEPVFYQTQLRGIDEGWSAASDQTTRKFSALSPATYEFEVRAIDRFGRAGPVTQHEFTIVPAWWRTRAAYLLYAASLALAGWSVARWQIIRLRRQNVRLNQLVAERTKEIELVSIAKSDFLENISHEIRNPLNGLSGLLALLKEDRLNVQERELARSLKHVASTLTHTFEDVLQFSKLEYGYGQLQRRPFALRPLLLEIVELFRTQANESGCALEVHWPDELVDGFEGDAEKIKTIVSNFVGNALKYAPGAPVEIKAEATAETDGMVDLYVDVIDHGPGVPDDEQELIFKKFVRGKRAQTGKISGSGLGLATCRVMAKLMNGSVGVERTAGHGATFHLKLLLPRADIEQVPELLAASPDSADVRRVLIVDDEPYNRVVLEGIALELGATADATGTGGDAEQYLTDGEYDVIFLDWELPDTTGGEVAAKFRSSHPGSASIILATTAHDSEEMRQRCRASGMDGFLLKPYDTRRVREALSRIRANRLKSTSMVYLDTLRDGAPLDDGLDLQAFDHYRRSRPGDLATARKLYVQAIVEQATTLDAAVSAGEAAAISTGAHRLRALSGLVRATELNVAAGHLEEVARRGPVSACVSAWATTKAACDNLRERLA